MLGWRAVLIRNQHLKAHEIQALMPESLFDECYSFGFVRNPWDRLVSGYNYAKQTRRHPEHHLVRDMASISDYISFRERNHPTTQSALLFDQKEKQLVTKIGRFETLEKDFQEICADLQITAKLCKRNASDRGPDWREYYTERDYNRVAALYSRDIEYFGYANEAEPEKRSQQR